MRTCLANPERCHHCGVATALRFAGKPVCLAEYQASVERIRLRIARGEDLRPGVPDALAAKILPDVEP